MTDRDIVIGAIAQGPDTLESLTLGDVMTPDLGHRARLASANAIPPGNAGKSATTPGL